MSSFAPRGPPVSPSAARRATRTARASHCTSGGPRRRIWKRSVVPKSRRTPGSSGSAPAALCRTGSLGPRRLRGWWAGSRDIRRGSAWTPDVVAYDEGLGAVQGAGRWTSAQMPAHYARGELASKGAIARFHRQDH